MKRKRGPAPDGRQTRQKNANKGHIKETILSEQQEEEEDFDDQESFEGFSTDDETAEPIANDKMDVTTENGSTSNTKKRGKKGTSTQEDLMELLFRSSSFQSNLFKLQVDELLSEVRVKYDKMEKVEQVLHQLKGILTKLPESQEQLVFSM